MLICVVVDFSISVCSHLLNAENKEYNTIQYNGIPTGAGNCIVFYCIFIGVLLSSLQQRLWGKAIDA